MARLPHVRSRDLAESYNSIALLWQPKGESDKADHYLKKALKVCEDGLGDNHPIIERIRKNLTHIPR